MDTRTPQVIGLSTPAVGAPSPPSTARRLLAIDPGNIDSAFVVIDAHTRKPLTHGKPPNKDALDLPYLVDRGEPIVIEMIASYGMAVGAEVFDTCVWIGRFYQAAIEAGRRPILVKRLPVKIHHCHDSKAKDTNIRQALVDRFATGQPNNGKGTKANPGWFYGFRADIWAAYALAVYAADTNQRAEATGAA